ncbi:uncharacterized protein LOC100185413 [Ciona intestinalis]
MEFENDDELLEWDMEIDENFEDALDDDGERYDQDERAVIRKRNKQDRWATTRDDEDPETIQERWSGDGHSEGSLEYEDENTQQPEPKKEVKLTEMKVMNENAAKLKSSAESPTEEDTWSTFIGKDKRQKSSNKNSFSALASPARSEGGKFQVLDEDDGDITSYDMPPMEFRGSLKTNDYNPNRPSSCFCIVFRYIAIALLCFTIGLAFGYLVGYKQMTYHQVTERPPVVTSIRSIAENITLPNTATPVDENRRSSLGLQGGSIMF